MSYLRQQRFLLAPRNEAQLKSHNSCLDCRAWSHDTFTQNQYLREWMTHDMPKNVIPVSTLLCLLKTVMHNQGRVIPRCHRNCKSKIILDSIRTSCNAMRECLKEKQKCPNLFEEEEFETTHWPCDTCLEILKSIKMFWKIISEKVFHIKFGENLFNKTKCSRSSSLDSLATAWQREILNQTVLLKMFPTNKKDEERPRSYRCDRNVSSHVSIKSSSNIKDQYRSKDSISVTSYQVCNKIPVKTKQIAAKVKMVDVSCEARPEAMDDVDVLRKDLAILQRRYNIQKREISNILKENGMLKNELHSKLLNECASKNFMNVVPFEHELDDNVLYHKVGNTDSEMIITMKNCRHKCFHQVSLLQVIHKTNANVLPFNLVNVPNFQKEDPLIILRKVQNTFDSIVQKEISLVSDKSRQLNKNVDINASVQRCDRDSTRTSRSCAYSIKTPSSSSFLSAEEQRLLYKQ